MSSITSTATDAPGDAPRSAATLPSDDVITSVPNCSVPLPLSSVSLMTCTRCPAVTKSQSSSLAFGINSRNSFIRCSFEDMTCWIKYFVKGICLAPAANIVKTLFGLTEVTKSNIEPVSRNFGEKPAYGPNKSDFLLSIYLVSKCGTDIGGAPTFALPYTFA